MMIGAVLKVLVAACTVMASTASLGSSRMEKSLSRSYLAPSPAYSPPGGRYRARNNGRMRQRQKEQGYTTPDTGYKPPRENNIPLENSYTSPKENYSPPKENY